MGVEGIKKERAIGLDLFRVFAALVVFAFHTRTFANCRYGAFDFLASAGGIFMTSFFMLSGFSLLLASDDKKLTELKDILLFYKKRLIGILPLYLVVLVVYHVVWGNMGIKELLIVLPLDMLGLRTSLMYQPNLQFIWFVSNILICYLLFPFIHNVVRQMEVKGRVILAGFMLLLLVFVQIAQNTIHTEIAVYYSVFYRTIEFTVGVLAASMKDILFEKTFRFMKTWCAAAIEAIILLVGVRWYVFRGQTVLCQIYVMVVGLVFLCTLLKCKNLKIFDNTVFKYVCSCTYALYLSQIWVLKFCEVNIPHILAGISSLLKIVLIWGATFVLTVVLHEIVEKPAKKLLSPKR